MHFIVIISKIMSLSLPPRAAKMETSGMHSTLPHSGLEATMMH